MNLRKAIVDQAVSPVALQLVQDTMQALVDAEMAGTITALRGTVFGSGRVLEERDGWLELMPFAELLLLDLRWIADGKATAPFKDRFGLVSVHAAGW